MSGSGEKIVIKADPDIAELIPGYLENRRRDVIKIREAIESCDYKTIEYLGHSMRGSGEGYGFSDISSIGQVLERAAREHNEEVIQRQIDELVRYMGRLEVT